MSEIFDFSIEQIRSVCGAKWLQKAEKPPYLKGAGIDGREDLTYKAFIAIKGDTHDGHAHLQQAVDHGAQLLIVESAMAGSLKLPAGAAVVQVDSTRKALGRIAQAYRRSLRGTKVIGVVGSSGKTTTKRLINGALAGSMHGVASPKSFNNDLGVPLTLLMGKSSDKYMVVEIGTNAPGEVGHLSRLAEPDIAVITMVGREHLEGLGSVEGVAREEAAILGALPSDGIAIINADCPLLRPHLKLVKARILFGEATDADLRLTARGAEGERWFFEINGRSRFSLALPGRHNALNALAAVAVARRLGLDDDEIRAGLLTVQPDAMRLMPVTVGGVSFLNDAYNANPDSMAAAIETFAETSREARRRVIVLGDMLELGPASEDMHREVGRLVAKADAGCRLDHAVFIGPHMRAAAQEAAAVLGAKRCTHVDALNEPVIADIRRLVKVGDAVLVKGSRGMRLERLIAAFEPPVKSESSRTPRAVKLPA